MPTHPAHGLGAHDSPRPRAARVVFDAIVLAGGAGRRLGPAVAKPEVVVGGLALVDHALAAVAAARHVVLVAPEQHARPGIPRTLEDPPGGGPVAGLAAGLAHLHTLTTPTLTSRAGGEAPGGGEGARVVVVLACDVPRAAQVVDALVVAASTPGVDGARLVAADGAPQHLVAAYRTDALVAALAGLDEVRGASMRRALAGLRLVGIPDPDDVSRDADTWPDVAALDERLGARPQISTAEPDASAAGRRQDQP